MALHGKNRLFSKLRLPSIFLGSDLHYSPVTQICFPVSASWGICSPCSFGLPCGFLMTKSFLKLVVSVKFESYHKFSLNFEKK